MTLLLRGKMQGRGLYQDPENFELFGLFRAVPCNRSSLAERLGVMTQLNPAT